MMLVDTVARTIEEEALLSPGAAVVVGVSGGIDSVVLLHVLRRLGYGVRAAHVNYGLRGKASEGDEAFVRAWCAEAGVPLDVARLDARGEASARRVSVQEAARDLRYAWFEERARAHAASYVAVAHHLDDQVETVLLHLFRGSGPEGLAGMPVSRPIRRGSPIRVVRPLLHARREAVEAYARAEALSWREDASNASLKYRRGALREAILPAVEAHFGPAVRDNVARSAALLRGYVGETVQPALQAAFEQAALPDPEGPGRLSLAVLRTLSPAWRQRVLLEALQRWLPGSPRSRATASAVDALLDAQPGRRVSFLQGDVWRDRDALVFVAAGSGTASPDASDEVRFVYPGETVPLARGGLSVELLDAAPASLDPGTNTVVYVDARRLFFPLQVRRWQAGDRLQPFGMTGTKKVSDLLTDARVPAHRRREVEVLLSGEEIVWVIGIRLDGRFCVRPDTRAFAKILCFSGKAPT